jgi:hypothetical protein
MLHTTDTPLHNVIGHLPHVDLPHVDLPRVTEHLPDRFRPERRRRSRRPYVLALVLVAVVVAAVLARRRTTVDGTATGEPAETPGARDTTFVDVR